jgi:predicted N-acetyltransferase YhbS
MNIAIRPEHKDDYDSIKRINDEAFGQENEGLLVSALRKTSKYIPNLSLVAEMNNNIIGHILFYPLTIITKTGEKDVLSLAPISVLPKYQKKGVGYKLVKRGLDDCKKTNYDVVIVVGHPNDYPRFGFKPASKWKIQLPIDAPDEAFMAIELKEKTIEKYTGTVVFPKEYYDAL